MKEHETSADIIAEMRDEAAKADMEQDYSVDDAAEMMREFAWRFEAAIKRERGDCAKLREALVRCRNCAQMIPQFVQASRPERSSLNAAADYANLILRDVSDGLAAPPRNCDVGTAEERLYRYNRLRDEINERYKRLDEIPPAFAFPTAFEWEDRPYEEGCTDGNE